MEEMMYVPTAPPTQASPRIRELAQRITEAIRSFRQSHPDLSFAEIRQATRIALAAIRAEQRGGAFDATRLLPAALGVIVFLLGLGFFLAHNQENPEEHVTLAVAILIAVIGIIVVFAARHRSLK